MKFKTICFLFLPLWLGATIRSVDPAGGGNYQTVHAAVTAAAAGDTILVMSGEYAFTAALGRITVSKKLYILGSGYDKVENGGCKLIDLTGSGLFLLDGSSDGTVVKGFRMTSTATMIDVAADARYILIEQNLFVTQGGWAVTITSAQNDTVRENIICNSGTSSLVGYGIYFNGTTNSIINNNLIAGCWLCIQVSSNTNLKICNNILLNAGAYPYYAMTITGSHDVFSNAFMNCAYTLIASGTPYISNNGFYNCSYPASYGENYIDSDPKFITYTTTDYYNENAFDAKTFNFQLAGNSPYIDAGIIDAAYNDADGSRNDIGLYGGPRPMTDSDGIPVIPLVFSISLTPTSSQPNGTVGLTAKGRIGIGNTKTGLIQKLFHKK